MVNRQMNGFASELVCVRLVDEVNDRKLKPLHSTRDLEKSGLEKYNLNDAGSRFTVHFSLNYPYKTYKINGRGTVRWDNKKYGVLIPLNSLINSGQIPVNLHHADAFFVEGVGLTDDSRIVKGNNIVGKLINEMKEMGFQHKKGDIRGWKSGKYTEDKRKLRRLAKEMGATYKYHCNTIYSKVEDLIGIVKNWESAVDFWFSDHPKVIKFYKKQGNNIRKAYDELQELLPLLPNNIKSYAEGVMEETKRNFAI